VVSAKLRSFMSPIIRCLSAVINDLLSVVDESQIATNVTGIRLPRSGLVQVGL
jgi:hypothetical protein